MNEKDTQKKMVLAHLQQHGKLTPLDALALYGCYRLSSVIFRLRNDGHDIKTVNKTGRSRYGGVVKFAEYHLRTPKPQS